MNRSWAGEMEDWAWVGDSGERESLGQTVKTVSGPEEQKRKEKKNEINIILMEGRIKYIICI